VKVLTAICILVLGGAVWAQSAASDHTDSSRPTVKTFTGPNGTFRISYPDLLIRCERVSRKNGLTYSYHWEQPGCEAYIPPCSNADADDQPLLCLAYPPKFAHNPRFDAAVLTVDETTDSEKQCMADAEHRLEPITIQGVKFTGGESADAALGHYRNSKGYTAYHNGKCYALTITIVTTSGAGFDPPVKELTKQDWDEVDRPLEQARDSFEFLK
jgi:hypothetical protein